ncbi:MAG: protein TonB [Sulfurimonas sp.]|jgi:protein TonB
MKLKPLIILFVFLNVLTLHVYLFYNYSIPYQNMKVEKPSNYIVTLNILHEKNNLVKKETIKKSKNQKKVPAVKVKEIHKKILKQEKKIIEKKKQVLVAKKDKPIISDKKIEKEEHETINKKTVSKKFVVEDNHTTNKVKLVKPCKSKSIALDAKKQDESLKKYISYINTTILENKFYPKTAKNMGIDGKCTIMLCILNNGTIKEMKVVQKSNFTIFNKSALKIIEKIGSFKAFPYLLKKEIITLKIPIKYKLKG